MFIHGSFNYNGLQMPVSFSTFNMQVGIQKFVECKEREKRYNYMAELLWLQIPQKIWLFSKDGFNSDD
jgi:hypothetical protein